MSAWVLLSLLAASFQTVRFALQKRAAATGLTAEGATLSRFLFASPLALAGAGAALAAGGRVGTPDAAFWAWCAVGGLCQVLATICVVRLFGLKHFAIGMSLKKTEVLLTALAGLVLLGDALGPAATGFLILGFPALLLLGGRGGDWRALDGRAIALGDGRLGGRIQRGQRVAAVPRAVAQPAVERCADQRHRRAQRLGARASLAKQVGTAAPHVVTSRML
ncbi:MAG: hypothetical protein ACU0BS_12040 [Hasllibacter sp.]